MPPVPVDSTQCHLWTDALHIRQLGRETTNRWDRGTYVRQCVVVAWTALEIACQDVLNTPDIGYRFKENLDRAIASKGLPALGWSHGLWQQVRRLQELRKSYVHRFASLNQMFPESSVADEAVATIRAAIESLYLHVGATKPAWVDFDDALG